MSYTGLVLDRQRTHRGEELLDQIVLLAVERRATEEVDPERALERLPVVGLLLPGLLAGADHPLGDHVARLLEREVRPVARPRRPVLDPRLAHRAVDELLGCGSLWAQPSPGDRRIRVA